MVVSRSGPEGARAPFGLAAPLLLLMSTSVGHQDLGALIVQEAQIAAPRHAHLLASPFGTIDAATFSLPRPLGTAMPDPRRFELASLDARAPDVVGIIPQPDAAPVEAPILEPIAFPVVDRSGKGDLLGPRPHPDAADQSGEARAEPLPPELEAAMRGPSPADDALPDGARPGSDDAAGAANGREHPDLSILDAAADPDPTRHTAALFFDAEPALARLAALEPWGQGQEPTLVGPGLVDGEDIKQSARGPAAGAGDPKSDQAGVSVAGKGEVTGEGRRPKSPAERLALDGRARARAEKCLTDAVYFEARGEPVRGQIAVAQVVMNRVFSGYYPNNVCGVVYQNARHHLACQFTFACDGIPDVVNEPDAWLRAMRIAKEMLDGRLWLAEIGKATHYHAYWVHPSWARTMHKLYRIGVHTFYRPRLWGDGGRAPSWGTTQETAAIATRL